MDQMKIGAFIAERRKKVNLTQMQLAEKLNITDRAVSKWERGKAMPDASLMVALCDILEISVNDLICGEVVTVDNYNKEMESRLLELVRQKEQADRRLLSAEVFIGVFSTVLLLGFVLVGGLVPMDLWLRILLIVLGFVLGFSGFLCALRIEQLAGYYECGACGHRYVPSYKAVNLAMHMGRTRYMKCPKCGKYSWQKKVLSRD